MFNHRSILIEEKWIYSNRKKYISTKMSNSTDLKSASREAVLACINASEKDNRRRFLRGDDKASSEYIYDNQREDAAFVVDALYRRNRRIITVQKRTKVGADGFMIEVAKLVTTHNDDDFIIDPENVRIITGMSNIGWETDMIEKAPSCFKKNIFHHGKLSKANLTDLQNGLIIIDEIDTGDKVDQVLHKTLKSAGMLDVKYMEENNIRFVIISATIIKQLYDVSQWGELHEGRKMTIPANYIGHKEFLAKGIIKEFYDLSSKEEAERWVQEDIKDTYGNDYRVHIVRGTEKKNITSIRQACRSKCIDCITHTSDDRLTTDQINTLFKDPLINHIVLIIKGFFRRANLIPNNWKLRIGAMHELYTKTVDNNVQIQGLAGRMTGYWKDVIEAGHKTGPYRTSIQSIIEYENNYDDPFGSHSYHTNGFTKNKRGKPNLQTTMLSPDQIDNLVAVDLPEVESEYDISEPYDIYDELYVDMKKIIIVGNVTKYTNTDSTIQYRGVTIPLYTYESKSQFKKMDIYNGLNNVIRCRIMPVMQNGLVKWVAIYLKNAM